MKIMVYNMKRHQKKKKKKNDRKIVKKDNTRRKKLQILDYTIFAKLRMIFISYSYNYSSKPSTIVTFSLNSS